MVSVNEILSSFSEQGSGDTQLLMTILNAKRAENEYNASVINARTEYSKYMRLQYHQQQHRADHPISPPMSPTQVPHAKHASHASHPASPPVSVDSNVDTSDDTTAPSRQQITNALKYKFQQHSS